MYCILWKYEVDASKSSEFEKEYGRNGSWFKFFEECDDYLGTDLLKNTEDNTYTLIDRWIDKGTYDSFIKENQAKYDQLKDQSSELYQGSIKTGTFTMIQ